MPAVPQTKPLWTNNVDPLNSTNLHAYLRDPVAFLMSKPVARLRRDTTQSIVTGGSGTAVQFTLEDVDTDPDGTGGHSTVTNTSRYTARYPGQYRCTGGVAFVSNTTGRRGIWWMKNGGVLNGSVAMIPTTPSLALGVVARPITIALAEGDYVELVAYQESGAALNISGTTFEQASMDVEWVRL